MAKDKEALAALADKIHASLTGKDEISSEGDVFNDNLPEGLTPEVVDGVNDYVTGFSAAAVSAMGRYGVETMKKDKKLEDVSGTVPMGSFGVVECSVNRSTDMKVAGRDITVKGGTTVGVKFNAGKNAGALAAARRDIKTLAGEIL